MPTRKTEAYWVASANRWQVKVQIDGVRKTFTSSLPGKKGKIEAERKADAWMQNRLVGEPIKVDAIATQYLEHIDRSASSAHYRQQKQYIDNHILPVIGRKKIGQVTETDLQKVIDIAHKRGLARKTLSNLRACLVAIIKYARRSKCTTLLPEGLTIPASAPKSNKTILAPKDLHTLLTCDTTEIRGKPAQDWFIHAVPISGSARTSAR